MKILIATPLYPPDVAEAAAYSKELAKRLSGSHEVTVLAYGKYPEQIPGVRIIAVDKRQPLTKRLLAYSTQLRRAQRSADFVYAINGASIELPLLLSSFLSSVPIVFAIADSAAHARAGLPQHILEQIVSAHARTVVRDFPLPRPESMPLEPKPVAALAAYEQSWNTHLASLEKLFRHAR